MTFTPRPTQAEILKYSGGTMGISAVPGSGKTHTLSALAAKLVEKNTLKLHQRSELEKFEQEVLIVTFSNSAVANFASRIAGFLSENGMVPGIGYRVRTLHGMAVDIIRGRAESFGIDPDFVILDEIACETLLIRAVDLWLDKDSHSTFEAFVDPTISKNQKEKYYTDKWRQDIINISKNVISQAKDYMLLPEKIRQAIPSDGVSGSFRILAAICDIYESYQSMLKAYPALDYADLMYHAFDILQNDPAYLDFLQDRWPIILEDEAQDSSLIQEEILRLMTRKHVNWVRVGDPNQAINETFTTADPKYLKNFLKEAQKTVDLFNSGRSSVSVLRQANRLIQWTSQFHPSSPCRTALVEPYIKTTPKDDPQHNPPDDPNRIFYDPRNYEPAEEVEKISKLAYEHIQKHPEETLAILTPSNDFGTQFVSELEKYPVDVIEILKSNRKTRNTADYLAKILTWLSRPLNQKIWLDLFEMLFHHLAENDFYLSPDHCKIARDRLLSIQNVEDFLFPLSEEKFRSELSGWNDPEIVMQTFFSFRFLLKRWLDARFLKIDQLILLIAQDLFTSSDDLSISNQFGRILAQMVRTDPSLRLNALAEKLRETAANSSLHPGLQSKDSQFDPELYRGKIIVITYHGAKGLEWDQVFLTSCNNYDFPSGTLDLLKNSGNQRKKTARPFYIRNNLDLQAEALQQLETISFPEQRLVYIEGEGSQKAYNNAASERLRLLFVGITRAKKGLHVSWNTGRFGKQSEAIATVTLRKKQNEARS